VTCRTTSLPLGQTSTPISGCGVLSGTYPFAPVPQPSEPLALGTVGLDGNMVETVSVTKQVFDCKGLIGDLYLISETGEILNGNSATPIGTKYEGVMCRKDPGTAVLSSCSAFTPS
jgi:hypothetical protein